jgi:hypothetical protein
MVEFLALLANAVLWVVPLWVLVPRAGMSRNIAWIGVVPMLGMVVLWIVALKRWPTEAATDAVEV